MSQSVLTAQELPRNDITVTGEWFKQSAMRSHDKTGPNQTFSGWNPSSWGGYISYRNWVLPKLGVGLRFGVLKVPYAYQYNPKLGVLIPAEFVFDRKSLESEYDRVFSEILLTTSGRLSLTKHWSLVPSVSFGYAWVNSENGTFGGTVRDPNDLDNYLRFLSMTRGVNVSKKSIPLVQISCELGYKLRNYNTITAGIMWQISPRRDVFTGNYTLYPGTANESTGSFAGGIGHLGITLGYTMAWGRPKEPGYVRRKKRVLEGQ